MRKFNLLKIILIFTLIFAPISCTHLNNIENTTIEITNSIDSISGYDNILGVSMYNAFEKNFSEVQFDSICKADKLSNDLKQWYLFTSREGDTGDIFVEYMYIKNKLDQEIIYRLIPNKDNTYHITKRIKNR